MLEATLDNIQVGESQKAGALMLKVCLFLLHWLFKPSKLMHSSVPVCPGQTSSPYRFSRKGWFFFSAGFNPSSSIAHVVF